MLERSGVILLAVLWLLSQVCSASSVLCIGPDGRIALEAALVDGCGCNAGQTVSDAESAFEAKADSCRDVPLTSMAINKIVRMVMDGSAGLLAGKALIVPASEAHVLVNRTASAPPFFAPLETIVLTV